MEEDAGGSDSDSSGGQNHSATPSSPDAARRFSGLRRWLATALILSATGLSTDTLLHAADTLATVRTSGRLLYGGDKEGGGPYAFPDPADPRRVTGFEVELMDALARGLGAKATFSQGQWDRLLPTLDSGRVDVVANGYELTPNRTRDYLATRPYYVYQLQLIARRGGPIRSWDDLRRRPARRRQWRLGVMTSSAADTFAREEGGDSIRVVPFDGATDAMTAVQNGQIDATLQGLPAALFYASRFPKLALTGSPLGHGYYVIFLRKGDEALRDALDAGIDRLVASGELRRIYERYHIWNNAQAELLDASTARPAASGAKSARGLGLLWHYRLPLLDAAAMTVLLSVTSMPLAMTLGLLVALGRLYGSRPVRMVLGGYVEVLRGTPLMLQLYVLFFLLRLPPLVAGIGGLAINYSAYEAEIYRAGLQAIPGGQMEAALALGMSRGLALRRVLVPQAVRIVIPPVTNDFIALFKDTSVCSVITLVELTKQYAILGNSTGGWTEFALASALLYMLMSVPLSWFSRWSERRLGAEAVKGGAV